MEAVNSPVHIALPTGGLERTGEGAESWRCQRVMSGAQGAPMFHDTQGDAILDGPPCKRGSKRRLMAGFAHVLFAALA